MTGGTYINLDNSLSLFLSFLFTVKKMEGVGLLGRLVREQHIRKNGDKDKS